MKSRSLWSAVQIEMDNSHLPRLMDCSLDPVTTFMCHNQAARVCMVGRATRLILLSLTKGVQSCGSARSRETLSLQRRNLVLGTGFSSPANYEVAPTAVRRRTKPCDSLQNLAMEQQQGCLQASELLERVRQPP